MLTYFRRVSFGHSHSGYDVSNPIQTQHIFVFMEIIFQNPPIQAFGVGDLALFLGLEEIYSRWGTTWATHHWDSLTQSSHHFQLQLQMLAMCLCNWIDL